MCYGHGLHVGYSKKYRTVIAEVPGAKQYDAEVENLPVHTHLYPDKDNTYALKQFLIRARQIIKSYNKDNIVVVNSATDDPC